MRSAVPAVGLSGWIVLFFDQAAARWTLGYWVPTAWRFVAVYVLSGAAIALLVIFSRRIWERKWKGHRPSPTRLWGWTVAAIYTAALAERAQHVLWPGPGGTKVLWFLPPMIVVVAAAVWVLERIAGQEQKILAGFGVAVAAATGLAINRNLVASPLEPKALVLDAAVVLTVTASVVACRWMGRLRGAAATALGIVLMLGIGTMLGPTGERTGGPASAPSSDSQERRPPDLLLIMIDTLRQDVFQSVVESTPEGRAFREAFDPAAWFSNAIAAAPWTAPSMGSIMTGLYPREHGLIKPSARKDLSAFTRLPDEIPTLAEKLGRRGYQTSAIVANPILHPQSGLSRGFDRYEVLAGPTVKLPLLTALTRLGLLKREFYQQARWVKSRLRLELGQVDRDRPLFLWLHIMDPHDPLYANDLPELPGESELPEVDRLYRREVRYTLAELTDMLDLLKAESLWQESAVVLASDHGEMLPSDGRGEAGRPRVRKVHGHGHALYDELAKIPLVIRPPGGLPSPRQVDVLTHHTDLHDTLADLLGSDLRRIGRDRVSLKPWLEPEPATDVLPRQMALIEATHSGPEQRALRTSRWKLIEKPMMKVPPELYELTVDPLEQENLAPSRREQAADLSRRLKELWFSLEDPPITTTPELDDETRRQLEALGYL